MDTTLTEEQYRYFTMGLLAGDRTHCTNMIKGLLASQIDIKDIYINLFQRALYDVGERWEKGQISVAVEHSATAIVERLLTFLQPKLFTGGKRMQTAIIACAANEYHQLGARIVADVFELHGWRSYFLGANTPQHEVLELIRTSQPDVVGLSLSVYFNLPALLRIHAAIRNNFPLQKIIVGGQAFRWGGSDVLSADPHVVLIPSFDDLEKYILSYE